jgi:protein-export membrane protein SecD
VLTIGMAVDANVLIFERLKEELSSGKSMRMAFEQSFARAWTAILDSHVTTVLAGVALLMFGTGGIRGFAVCLIVGTACNLFTAVTVTKLLLSSTLQTRLGRAWWLFLGAREGS